MDGAQIPDTYIVEDKTAGNPIYSEGEIRTAHRETIVTRNLRKHEKLDKLCKKFEFRVPLYKSGLGFYKYEERGGKL